VIVAPTAVLPPVIVNAALWLSGASTAAGTPVMPPEKLQYALSILMPVGAVTVRTPGTTSPIWLNVMTPWVARPKVTGPAGVPAVTVPKPSVVTEPDAKAVPGSMVAMVLARREAARPIPTAFLRILKRENLQMGPDGLCAVALRPAPGPCCRASYAAPGVLLSFLVDIRM